MSPKEAAAYLAVSLDGLDTEALNDAFRRKVREHHPDANLGSGLRVEAYAIDKVKKARDTLREWLAKGGAPPVCRRCEGNKRIQGTFGMLTCPTCGGKGY